MTEPNENPLSYQVGGSHYKDIEYQPIEFFEDLHLDAFRANIIKYLARWRKKGGVEDLKKALHYAKVWEQNSTNEIKKTYRFADQFDRPERGIIIQVVLGDVGMVLKRIDNLIQVCTDGQTHWEGEKEAKK